MILELSALAVLGPTLAVLRALGVIDLAWPRVLLFLVSSAICAVAAKNLYALMRRQRTQSDPENNGGERSRAQGC